MCCGKSWETSVKAAGLCAKLGWGKKGGTCPCHTVTPLLARGPLLQGWVGTKDTSRCISVILLTRMYNTTHRKQLNTRHHNTSTSCTTTDIIGNCPYTHTSIHKTRVTDEAYKTTNAHIKKYKRIYSYTTDCSLITMFWQCTFIIRGSYEKIHVRH
jgi:hypothetical protein